jgi:hypothetical protein
MRLALTDLCRPSSLATWGGRIEHINVFSLIFQQPVTLRAGFIMVAD